MRFTKDTCPDKGKHTKCPEGYIAWHEWAEKKAKTHRQVMCGTCKLYMIWKPKKKRAKR